MSKSYYPPFSFQARMMHEGKYIFTISVSKTLLKDAEFMMNEIRPLNREAAGFMYTCTCTQDCNLITTWILAYDSEETKDRIHSIVKHYIKELKTKQHMPLENSLRTYYNPENVCSCPYNQD